MDRDENVACLLFFLLGARDDKQMYNSRTAEEALRAACELLDISEASLVLKSKGFVP